jgi:hypothetical protein
LFALYGPAARLIAPAEPIAGPDGHAGSERAAIGAAVTIELPDGLSGATSEATSTTMAEVLR